MPWPEHHLSVYVPARPLVLSPCAEPTGPIPGNPRQRLSPSSPTHFAESNSSETLSSAGSRRLPRDQSFQSSGGTLSPWGSSPTSPPNHSSLPYSNPTEWVEGSAESLVGQVSYDGNFVNAEEKITLTGTIGNYRELCGLEYF